MHTLIIRHFADSEPAQFQAVRQRDGATFLENYAFPLRRVGRARKKAMQLESRAEAIRVKRA